MSTTTSISRTARIREHKMARVEDERTPQGEPRRDTVRQRMKLPKDQWVPFENDTLFDEARQRLTSKL